MCLPGMASPLGHPPGNTCPRSTTRDRWWPTHTRSQQGKAYGILGLTEPHHHRSRPQGLASTRRANPNRPNPDRARSDCHWQ
eukprot:6169917-Prymnesium_polylepis.1